MKMKFFWNPEEKSFDFNLTKRRQTISFCSLVSAFNSASSPKEINRRIPPDRQLFLPQWVFFITCTSPRHTHTHYSELLPPRRINLQSTGPINSCGTLHCCWGPPALPKERLTHTHTHWGSPPLIQSRASSLSLLLRVSSCRRYVLIFLRANTLTEAN